MSEALLFDILGNMGMVALLAGYFLLQKNKIEGTGYPYLTINLVGSLLLLISLTHHWNLAAFLLEAAWCLISLYGMFQRYRKNRSAVS